MKEAGSPGNPGGKVVPMTGDAWPRTYRIVVRGRLDASWSDRLAGMTISPQGAGAGDGGTTVLEGPIRDESELSGVLNTLSDLHFAPLSLALVDEGTGETPPDADPAT